MGTKWTAERHEKMRALWAVRRQRSAGRAPSGQRAPTRVTASPLGNEIAECLEARAIVNRIGWDLARSIAARVDVRE